MITINASDNDGVKFSGTTETMTGAKKRKKEKKRSIFRESS